MLDLLRRRLGRASLLAWLALFALVAAPTLSRALAAADPLAYAAVCSSTATGTTEPALPQALGHVADACGLCAVAALPLLAAAPAAAAKLALHERAPATTPAAPAQRSLWRSAQSRAPPFFA
jgi:hypothetical protein